MDEELIKQVLTKNSDEIEEHRKMCNKVINSLIGKVMKISKGKASPQEVRKRLLKKLDCEWIDKNNGV